MLSRTTKTDICNPMIKVPVLSLMACVCAFSIIPLSSAAHASLDLASLEAFEGFVDPSDQKRVTYYINQFLSHPETTGALIAQSTIYLPTVEKELSLQNMPEELRVLPLIESRYNPLARSRVGAVGLWQFMVPTARQMGLKINQYVDERCDPSKATRAALSYLQYLHAKYDDWTLAFAAYNAGPSRVNRAIRMAGGVKSFEAIKQFLPKQTQEYIPKYLAAQYIIEHHIDYGIVPEQPDLDMQMIGYVHIDRKMSIEEISRVTNLDADKILMLNPSLKRSYIPSSEYGYDLILPRRVISAFEHYLWSNEAMPSNMRYHTIELLVSDRTSIFDLSEECSIDPYLLKAWNNLQNTTVEAGTIILMHELYNPYSTWERIYHSPRQPVTTFSPLPDHRSKSSLDYHLSLPEQISKVWQESLSWDMHQTFAGL